jgi:hypothetical protein
MHGNLETRVSKDPPFNPSPAILKNPLSATQREERLRERKGDGLSG